MSETIHRECESCHVNQWTAITIRPKLILFLCFICWKKNHGDKS